MRLYELVNTDLFKQGYEKKKPILDGKYILVATAGYVGYGSKPGYISKQFRIVAKTAKGDEIGWVNFENKDDNLEALDLSIQPAHRRQGIATEMYLFAKELGNTIKPSSMQTSAGKSFWAGAGSKLTESSEEDRALISLAQSIYDMYKDSPHPVNLGKIGDSFDTPIDVLNDIQIELAPDEEMKRRAKVSTASDVIKNDEDEKPKKVLGLWDSDTDTIFLNHDYLGYPRMKSIVTHELRHALDDIKSGYEAGASKRYFTPRNKEHRDKESPFRYKAQPAEINARFTEVLHILSTSIKNAYKRIPPDQLRPRVVNFFNNLMDQYHIADIFPERTESPQFKRLVKRGMDFIQKEMEYIEKTSSIKATDNWQMPNPKTKMFPRLTDK